ncbi:30S ribosomal protein S4e [Candidatus Woesearchaeota archaeon]|nr:30S ribosomal protein S4e [Candidatus Woesearchaeota archaeon]
MSRHLVRISAPKTWPIKRKGITFIVKPRGSHPAEQGLPLLVVLRELLHFADTAREVKRLLHTEELLVDGRRVKDHKRIVGLFDVITIPKIKENYRMHLNRQGKIAAMKVADANLKPCKIIGKTMVAGKVQLNLHDGKNLFGDNSSKVGDTLLLEVPDQKIVQQLRLERGAAVYITKGKHLGSIGIVESISDSGLVCKSDAHTFLMPKAYAFVLGKGKSAIQVDVIDAKADK